MTTTPTPEAVERFDPPRNGAWERLPMRVDIAGQYVRYRDYDALLARVDALTKERDMFEAFPVLHIKTELEKSARTKKAEADRDAAIKERDTAFNELIAARAREKAQERRAISFEKAWLTAWREGEECGVQKCLAASGAVAEAMRNEIKRSRRHLAQSTLDALAQWDAAILARKEEE